MVVAEVLPGTETEREAMPDKLDTSHRETWHNVSKGVHWVTGFDARGDERAIRCGPGLEFAITQEEREINQTRIIDPKNDPFVNGLFRPVQTAVKIDDQRTLANALSDEEIALLVKASRTAWTEWLKTIDSPITLDRMLTMIDSEEVDISSRRLKQLQARATEVRDQVNAGSDISQITGANIAV